MRNRSGSDWRNALPLMLLAGCCAAIPPTANGQAMVTYGVNVGRAAGAGAAAGAGTAGIFDKLGRTTAKAANHEAQGKPGVKPNPEPGQQAASPNAITIGGDKSSDAAGERGTVRTASGITIAGLVASKPSNGEMANAAGDRDAPASASPSQPADFAAEPEGFPLPEVPSPDPAPVAAIARQPEQAPVVQPESHPDVPDNGPAPAGPPKPASMARTAEAPALAEGVTRKAVAPHSAPASSPAPSTIAAGTPIQDVIKLLGQPLMRLSGVAGSAYEERYVFLAADGSKMTILVQDGLVLKVIVE